MWNTLWIIWALMFAVLETWAIVTKAKGGTLSERLREWLGIYPAKGWRMAGASLVAAFCIWFFIHIVIDLPGVL